MPLFELNNYTIGIFTQSDYDYTFYNHFHPFVGRLIERSNKGTLKDVLTADLDIDPIAFFNAGYDVNPNSDPDIKVEGKPYALDLEPKGPYSIYNWEIFFHIPLAIAVQLSKNQRFADAQKWFHFIFDPTTDNETDADNPSGRYWNFRYFRDNTDVDSITDMLETLSTPDGQLDEEGERLKALLLESIAAWKKTPFSPHTVAKFRPLAYQYNVVMKYLDNLFDWGDSLFRQFTMESINEATQIYVLASHILGKRPEQVPPLRKRPVKTYRQIKNQLDAFGNLFVEMENDFPLNGNHYGNGGNANETNSLLGIGAQLYFCIPKNDRLLAYWDKVADRLAKIRHCMDIEGNIRPLPLFQPPIDPGMLVRAAAAGLDLSSVVAGLNQPVSPVRFRVIYDMAFNLCGELRAMGRDFLSAIEKGDSEKIALIRQEHEIKMNDLINDMKFLRWKEAEENTKAILMSRESTFERYRHYQRLLGNEDVDSIGELTLEQPLLTEENFDEVYADLVESYAYEIDADDYKSKQGAGAKDPISGDADSEHLQLNEMEDRELNIHMPNATAIRAASAGIGAAATALALIPQFNAHGTPLGVGVSTGFGGVQISKAVQAASQLVGIGADVESYKATRTGKLGSYQRRIDEWVATGNQTTKELQEIGRRLISSLINEQALKKDYENHQVLREQAQAIEDFLKQEKFTTEEMYLWMQGELSKVYYDAYKLAHDTAKKAEVTLKHELMRNELNEREFVKFNYWDAGRKGLLSGEALVLDLKRMELAYHENNKREFEITKHVSVKRLNPAALLKLKATGSCSIDLPEWLYDLDCPGHYMRRIKSVSISIPCIAGPYTSVNCTLSLQKSSLRTSALLSDGVYERQEEDIRFTDNFGAIQSIVTSNAQNDSGMFNLNLDDQRFLPFENAGAISSWTLDLPDDFRQFDYMTIADVILHVRYTARQGGEFLKTGAGTYIAEALASDGDLVWNQMLSLKHDFPNEWYQFKNDETQDMAITITGDHLPYLTGGRDIVVKVADSLTYEIADEQLSVVDLATPALDAVFPDTGKTVTFDHNVIAGKDDLFFMLAYSLDEA